MKYTRVILLVSMLFSLQANAQTNFLVTFTKVTGITLNYTNVTTKVSVNLLINGLDIDNNILQSSILGADTSDPQIKTMLDQCLGFARATQNKPRKFNLIVVSELGDTSAGPNAITADTVIPLDFTCTLSSR